MDTSYLSEKKASALDNPSKAIVWTAAFVMGLMGMYYAIFFPFETSLYVVLHLCLAVGVFALIRIEGTESTVRRLVHLFIIALILATSIYLWTNFGRLQTEAAMLGYTTTDVWMAVPIIIIVTEYTRQEFGNAVFAVIVTMALYALFGPYMPGLFEHSGVDFERFVEISTLSFRGTLGKLTVIAALWIYIFIIWAGLMRTFDEITTVIGLLHRALSNFKAGIFQIAVIGSMAVGSIIGTPTANIVITGNFTIPLMESTGISKERAAAIESVASTGGGVLPPIMGSAAFVMATITATAYSDIIILAVFPAVLLYVTIAVGVYIATKDVDMDDLTTDIDQADKAAEPTNGPANMGETTAAQGGPAIEDTTVAALVSLIPVLLSGVVLVYLLAVLRYGPTSAGLYTIATYLGAKLLMGLVTRTLSPVDFVENTANGLVKGSIMMAPITIILSAMGMLVEVLTVTSLPLRIAFLAGNYVGEALILVFLAVLAVSILFGMAMPIVAAYLLTAALMEPLLAEAGVPLMAGHFFILYGASVSALTPPIAISCVIASNIVGANFWKTCEEALRIGFPYFLLPFAIVYYDSLLFYNGLETFLILGLLIVSFVSIQYGLRFERNKALAYNLRRGAVAISGVLLFLFPIGFLV